MTTENPTGTKSDSIGMSVTALVLGIVSFVPGCCIAPWSLVISCLAVVFGVIGRKAGGRGMATAGLVLGITNIVLVVGLLIAGIGLQDSIQKWADDQEQRMNEAGSDDGGASTDTGAETGSDGAASATDSTDQPGTAEGE